MTKQLDSKIIIEELENIAQKNKTVLNENLISAVEILVDNTVFVCDKVAVKTPLTSTREISICSAAHRLLSSEQPIALAATKLLCINDYLESDNIDALNAA